jgi:large subunit ribosomal protein L18
MATLKTTVARQRRQARVRRRVRGTDVRPRLCVFRSNKHIYAQVISDETGRTLVAASTLGLEGSKGGNKVAARQIGERIAQLCQEKQISAVVFDRNGFLFHGRIKEVAEGARAAGLQF